MEVKTGKYEPADLGQLSGYMVMAKHVLNTPEDNPPDIMGTGFLKVVPATGTATVL